MDKKEVSKEFNKLFSPSPFSIPKISPTKKIEEIKKEFANFRQGDDYFISGDSYFVCSEVMKNRLRDIVWERTPGKSQEVGGNFFDSDIFSYKHGNVKNSLDEFVLFEGGIDDSLRLIEIDDEETEKQKAEGVKTISSQGVEKERLINKKEKNKKKAENKLDTIQESQSKKDNDKKDKGGNAGLFLIGGSVFSLLTFGLFLVGTAKK